MARGMGGCAAGLLVLAGCATGIVEMDKGEYTSSASSAGGAFGNPESVLADLYTEARAFCAKSGQELQTVATNPENGIPFVRPARATLKFRCVSK